MRGGRRIDWGLCRRQTMVYAVAGLVYSTFPAALASFAVWEFRELPTEFIYRLTLLLATALAVWFSSGLLLSVGAQWMHVVQGRGMWRGVLLVVATAAFHGPVNRFLVMRLVAVDAPLPIPSGIYMFWLATLCGGLFFSYCVLMQRSRYRQGLIAGVEVERVNTEAQLRGTRAQALEQRIDPALLEQSLGALRITYARDRAAGEDLLGALVEALRLAVPAARRAHAAEDGAGAARAWANLRARLDAFPATPADIKGES